MACGDAYHVLFGVNPDGANDCFFYLKNDSDSQYLVIEGFWYTASAAEEVNVYIAQTGTAVKTNGSDLTPVNLNASSGKAADVTCYGETADAAVDITGLSGGRNIDKLWITALADNKFFNFEQDVVLDKNDTFSLYAVGGDVLIRGNVVFHMIDKDLVG